MSALTKMRLFSPALGMCVTLDIVLPVRKDHAPGHKLPVLWLLHGATGCHSDWLRLTSVVRYAAPYGLALVMPSAHNSSYTDMAHGQKFYTYISKELPETLPKMLNLSTRREDNFIAGLSMGGAGSMMIGDGITFLELGMTGHVLHISHGRRRSHTMADQCLRGFGFPAAQRPSDAGLFPGHAGQSLRLHLSRRPRRSFLGILGRPHPGIHRIPESAQAGGRIHLIFGSAMPAGSA